ncbi:Dual specificity protein phosphatase 1B [Linum perenne]
MDQTDCSIMNVPIQPLKNNVTEREISLCQIEEGLFLGSITEANMKDALKRANVTHILTVASFLPSFPEHFQYKTVNIPSLSFALISLAVMDREDTDIAQHFDECFNFIDEAKRLGGGVLVHCFMGVSRSVTIVVAYLMKKHYMTLSQALQHVRSRRPQANPNPGFISQLRKFQQTLQGESLAYFMVSVS